MHALLLVAVLRIAAPEAPGAPGGMSGSGAWRPASAAPPPALRSDDRWFGADKLKHFFISAFIQSVSYSMLRAADVEHRGSVVGASVATAAVGLGKEIHDRRARAEFSVRDLAWDAAGAGAATLLLERSRR